MNWEHNHHDQHHGHRLRRVWGQQRDDYGAVSGVESVRGKILRELILQNAAEINRLHARVHLTYESKDQDEVKRKEWSEACAEFRDKYDRLAFPGGFDGAYEKILAGDPEAMEAAICFADSKSKCNR